MTHTNQTEHDFLIAFRAIQADVHKNALEHGLWNGKENWCDCIGILQNELHEMREAHKNGNPQDEHLPQYKNRDVELADIQLSLMSIAAQMGVDLAEIALAKSRYNVGREYLHGKKF